MRPIHMLVLLLHWKRSIHTHLPRAESIHPLLHSLRLHLRSPTHTAPVRWKALIQSSSFYWKKPWGIHQTQTMHPVWSQLTSLTDSTLVNSAIEEGFQMCMKDSWVKTPMTCSIIWRRQGSRWKSFGYILQDNTSMTWEKRRVEISSTCHNFT